MGHPFTRLFARVFPRPVFADDDEKTRIAAVASDLMGVIIIILSVTLTFVTLLGLYRTAVNIGITWATLGLLFVCRYFLKRGQVRLITLIAATAMVVAGLAISYAAGSVGGVQSGAALIGITFCALTLGPRAGAVLSALAIGGFGWITAGQVQGWLSAGVSMHPVNQWLSLVTFCLILLAVAALVRRHLLHAVDRAYRGQLALEAERESRRMALEHANDELEGRVAERTRELALALKELEAFSYSVSHDLRGPLLSINGHAALLQRQEAQALSEGGRARLAGIARNSVLMGEMIEDILRYCRVGFPALQIAEFNMDTLAREAAAAAGADWPETQIVIGPLGSVRADAAMMRQVWDNLLGNACKYASGRDRPQVDVSMRREGPDLVFRIRDNGAGFDMQYAGKLFGMFQRMHTAYQFDGHGIGLAIVKRLVERHGGRVWAEAVPDQGASFYFSLPAAAAIG